ncbi:protein-L-isoaspartate(D-aspartate) O-methyltransferase [Roseiarcus fermentans]|uniref:Protein-L-isoaspartate O-methyltransferase n=1 Tax=Roseiarcus fermentans TaxID=1473586 RepID=A0A366FQ41_9HYPH|nr:rRNA adenine N-6-methyltransferase family protein [Roseiarcus fermentans]RBP16813.1 protein-L-isoaspartate(D-aspartate) O-methyltransferase [Roseiarcus fermentans]
MSASEAEERAQFTLAMRAKGIESIDLLRALERVPRALFMPQRFADLSGRDIALPIGCGQTSPPPSAVAAMIAALDIQPTDTVCEIGTGTGYCTALLAQFAKEVVSLERFQTLAVEAAARVRAFGLGHVEILWADGFEQRSVRRRFDKVIAHGIVVPPAREFLDLLAPGGAMVASLAKAGAAHRIVRLTLADDGPVRIADYGRARGLRPLERGLSRAL